MIPQPPKLKTILGAEYKDSISGLQGIAVSATAYLYACERVCLQPQETKDGKPAEMTFFDFHQLEYTGAGISLKVQEKLLGAPKSEDKRDTGGPGDQPQRQQDARR